MRRSPPWEKKGRPRSPYCSRAALVWIVGVFICSYDMRDPGRAPSQQTVKRASNGRKRWKLSRAYKSSKSGGFGEARRQQCGDRGPFVNSNIIRYRTNNSLRAPTTATDTSGFCGPSVIGMYVSSPTYWNSDVDVGACFVSHAGAPS